MRSLKQPNGFTIIETVLFLAISSLMIIGAMSAVSGRTQQVQFTDSIRSLESFIEGRISQVENGSITADLLGCRFADPTYTINSTPSSSNGTCTFLGYLFRLGNRTNGATNPTNSEVQVFQVYGRRINTSDPCLKANPNEQIYCAYPYVYPTPVETFQIPWGLEVTESETSTGEEINMFGYLRNPSGLNMVPIAILAGSEGSISTPSLYRTSSVDSWIGDEFSFSACFTNDSRDARLSFGNVDRQYAVEANLESSTAGCP
jgi:type II secretory pathway pseudopilin PulG